jgi:hypothetical protein
MYNCQGELFDTSHMEIRELTLNAVRRAANSPFVIGTERRSVVFCMLFRTATEKGVNVFLLEPFRKNFSIHKGNKTLAL